MTTIAASASSPTSNTKDSSTPFRLLHLPTELVVSILKFAVVISSDEHPIVISAYNDDDGLAAQPAVTRTCHLLRKEGLKLFYSENIFSYHFAGAGTNVLSTWLSSIGAQWASKVSCVRAFTWRNNTFLSPYSTLWILGKNMESIQFHHASVAEQVGMFVRTRDGKVVVGKGGCVYEFSFRGHDAEAEGWLSLKAVQEFCRDGGQRTDWWVVHPSQQSLEK